ncbi:YiiX/YebB-like N1pC/P60 family cysteine hydrolase [Halobacteriovorax sp. GB3]|uniref:YiiX/YebB-like N1pC/P60 family cysteine hydrolase n=1 Tax=Halobacteriovorax sp. GB3 TaxID=2719615 RepID=UPI00236192C4|nr:YiiX/YebB-like N1pC/P60 family cysteine hydrolase [Halobacteriovorax sp. GB3]MDD0852377.1 YiiX/YebB-like N1pC/P60 family cysteine hydrolase [Halobacteriovorax sp. GB3]
MIKPILRLILGALIFMIPFNLFAFEIKSGDVILLPLNCRSCDVIASETEGNFSHSGVVLRHEGEFVVLEALSKVRMVPLDKFLRRTAHSKEAVIMRSKEFELWNQEELNAALYFEFSKIEGNGFDYAYRWDNYDEQGRELFYCSEFVAKIFNPLLKNGLETYPMDFSKNWEYWYRAFGGNVPQGLPGNSPNELYRDHSRLKVVAKILHQSGKLIVRTK